MDAHEDHLTAAVRPVLGEFKMPWAENSRDWCAIEFGGWTPHGNREWACRLAIGHDGFHACPSAMTTWRPPPLSDPVALDMWLVT